MPSANETVARLLEELADREEIKGTQYKPRAYRRAARNIHQLDVSVVQLREDGTLGDVDGVGDAIRSKIIEALDTGSIDALDRLREEVPIDLDTLGRIQGLGAKKLATLWQQLDVTTLDELEAAAEDGRVGELPGFGPKTVETILDQADRVRQAAKRWRLSQLEDAADAIDARLEAAPGIDALAAAGALRRRAPVGEGLTLVGTADDADAALDAFEAVPEAAKTLGRSATRATVRLVTGPPAELVLVEPDAYGAALAWHTGAQAHLDALDARAAERGLTLTDAGLTDDAGEQVAGAREAEIYEALDVPLVPPELREGLGEVDAAAIGELEDLVTLDDIRGDLQMHTVYSDGATSVEAMAEKAQALGYEYLLVTDHGPSLTVDGAPTLDELREQGAEIEALNEAGELDVTVLWGVEANITREGLDVPPEVCEALDLVVASLHDTVDDATDRVVHALEAYTVDVFGHPTNRLINEREGNQLDMDRIVAAARDNDVAIEINAQPKRLDLDWRTVHRYRGQVPFIVSTDAHSPRGMEVMRYGVDQARKAWLTPDDVLNTQPLETLVRTLRG